MPRERTIYRGHATNKGIQAKWKTELSSRYCEGCIHNINNPSSRGTRRCPAGQVPNDLVPEGAITVNDLRPCPVRN